TATFLLSTGSLIVGSVRPEDFNENLGCDSCGRDCSAVCGSRQFRSCCFNYIKKRSESPAQPSIGINNDSGPGQANASYRREMANEDQLLPVIPISSVANGKGFPSETLEAANHRLLLLAEIPFRGNTAHHQQPLSSRKFFLSSLK
ncbi:unnamed protein product, partial [Allacma fusca]